MNQEKQAQGPPRAARRSVARPDVGIGARLRAERERRRMSLRELARRLGVTPSLISQIETGKSKPSVVTLYGIASELGLSIDELLFAADGTHAPRHARAGVAAPRGPTTPGTAPRQAAPPPEDPPDGPVQRAALRKAIELESGVRWERLTAARDPDVDFLYCVYDVGGASSRDPALLRHPGKEYGLVIRGRLRVTVGFDAYVLEPGDSVSFDSTTPHRYANVGDEPVHVITCVVRVR